MAPVAAVHAVHAVHAVTGKIKTLKLTKTRISHPTAAMDKIAACATRARIHDFAVLLCECHSHLLLPVSCSTARRDLKLFGGSTWDLSRLRLPLSPLWTPTSCATSLENYQLTPSRHRRRCTPLRPPTRPHYVVLFPRAASRGMRRGVHVRAAAGVQRERGG